MESSQASCLPVTPVLSGTGWHVGPWTALQVLLLRGRDLHVAPALPPISPHAILEAEDGVGASPSHSSMSPAAA